MNLHSLLYMETQVKKIIPLFLTALFAVASHAGMYVANDDEAAVLRVYNTSTQACVIVVSKTFNTNNTITVTFGSDTANTLTTGTTTNDTVTRLATSLAGCTNDAGQTLLIVDSYCSVGSDITTNRFLTDTTNTIAAKACGAVAKWDASVVKRAELYLPSMEKGGSHVIGKVEDLWSYVPGTGDATFTVYKNGTLYYYKTMPVNSNAINVDNNVIEIPFLFGAGESMLFRAARATTLTDAYVGAVTE